MAIKKIKDWLRLKTTNLPKGAQFFAIEMGLDKKFKFSNGVASFEDVESIKAVERLKDGIVFKEFQLVYFNGEQFSIFQFNKDMIHVSIFAENKEAKFEPIHDITVEINEIYLKVANE